MTVETLIKPVATPRLNVLFFSFSEYGKFALGIAPMRAPVAARLGGCILFTFIYCRTKMRTMQRI
jgi:hypothetical protein